MPKVYVGDVGTILKLDTGENLGTATAQTIKYTRPDATTGYWSGEVVETTKVKYVIQAGDWDVAGEWFFQSYVELPDWQGHGETAPYTIYSLGD